MKKIINTSVIERKKGENDWPKAKKRVKMIGQKKKKG